MKEPLMKLLKPFIGTKDSKKKINDLLKRQIEDITENIDVTDLKFNGIRIEYSTDTIYGTPFVKLNADYVDYKTGTPLKVGSKITVNNYQDDNFYGFCGIKMQIIIKDTNKINKFIGLGFFQHTRYGRTGEETWTLDLPNCQRLILNFVKDMSASGNIKASKQFEVTAIEDFQFVEVVNS